MPGGDGGTAPKRSTIRGVERRREDRVDGDRQQRQPRHDRRPAAQPLQVEHGDELEADERAGPEQRADVRARDRPSAQQTESHERRARPALDGDEGRE